MNKYCNRELSTFLPDIVGRSVLKMRASTYSRGDLKVPADMAESVSAGRRTLRVWEEVELQSISLTSIPKLEDTKAG